MHGRMMTIYADNRTPELEYLDAPPTFETLQAKVGGYIEAVPHWYSIPQDNGPPAPCAAFCNEEGKLNGLPLNVTATALWHRDAGGSTGDVLVGDVVLIWGDRELIDAL